MQYSVYGIADFVDVAAVVEVSYSYNNLIVIYLNLSADTGILFVLVGASGKVDAVYTVEGVYAVFTVFHVSVTAEVKKVVVIVKDVCELVVASVYKIIGGMVSHYEIYIELTLTSSDERQMM